MELLELRLSFFAHKWSDTTPVAVLHPFTQEEKEDGELEEGEIVEKVTRSNKEARKRPRFDPPVQGPEIRRGTSVGGLSAGMNGALQEPRTVGHRSGVSSPPSGAPTTSGAQTNAFATGSFFPVVSSGHLPQIYPTISQPHPTPNVPLEPMQQQQPQQHLPQIPQNVIVQGTHVLHDTLKPRFAIVGPAMGNMAQRPLMVDQQVNQQPLMSQQPFIINQGINRPPLIVRPVQHPPQQPQPSIYAGAAPAVAVPGNQHVVGLQQPLLGPQLGVQQIPGQLNPLQPPQSPQPPQPPQHNVLNLQQFPAFGGLQTSSQGGQGPIEALPIQSMGLNVVPRQYPFFQ
ncbi:unnamed protein product [Ostreobium quekettii]|uniref:Uncharacterized protein n=1 Tax=Ostreobium quekettii TaxID=121088 RepID=A0A8S1ITJ9_9CHLO|nr:unnamed protein product [Ostreobium quekettii]|eukprot:evm.model.scf_967.1 EVM.evm.TU.scf_967.1   scf_967:48146-49608(+)